MPRNASLKVRSVLFTWFALTACSGDMSAETTECHGGWILLRQCLGFGVLDDALDGVERGEHFVLSRFP